MGMINIHKPAALEGEYQSKDEKMKQSYQKQGEDIRSDARAENKALSTEQ